MHINNKTAQKNMKTFKRKLNHESVFKTSKKCEPLFDCNLIRKSSKHVNTIKLQNMEVVRGGRF